MVYGSYVCRRTILQPAAQQLERVQFEGYELYVSSGVTSSSVRKSKFHGAFMLNRRVDLHAIDATSAPWRGPAGPSPLDGASTAASSPRNEFVKNHRVHPTHLLISTQLVAVDERPVFQKRALVAGAPALEAIKPLPSAAADDGRHRWIWSLAVAVIGTRELYVVVLACVEIKQCVRCTFLDDDAAVMAPSSGEEPAPPRHRAGIASMAWRTTR